MTINKYSAIAVSLITAGLLFTSTALAVTLSSQANVHANNKIAEASSRAGTVRQNDQTKLQDAKLRSCQAREKGITNRSVHLGQLATTMEGNFDAIAARVKDYYTTKVLPGGKTVANYDSLVADISTKKTAVQTAVTKAQADVAGFSCTGEDPKGQMTAFRDDMQAVKQSLKEYRTSIKNLIVAVHSITGTTNREKSSSESSKSSNQGGNKP